MINKVISWILSPYKNVDWKRVIKINLIIFILIFMLIMIGWVI